MGVLDIKEKSKTILNDNQKQDEIKMPHHVNVNVNDDQIIPSNNSPDSSRFAVLLVNLFEKCAPDQVHDVSGLLMHYHGKEEEVYESYKSYFQEKEDNHNNIENNDNIENDNGDIDKDEKVDGYMRALVHEYDEEKEAINLSSIEEDSCENKKKSLRFSMKYPTWKRRHVNTSTTKIKDVLTLPKPKVQAMKSFLWRKVRGVKMPVHVYCLDTNMHMDAKDVNEKVCAEMHAYTLQRLNSEMEITELEGPLRTCRL